MTPLATHDLRAALRVFRSHPIFAASVVSTVAGASGFLGVATNMATVLLTPYFGDRNTAWPIVSVVSEAITRGGISEGAPLAAILPVAAVLLIAACMVLVTGCANLATLSMSHYRTRLSEFAIRASIGGTPKLLLRQLYAEGLLLSVAACALGGVFAFWTRQGMFASLSPEQAGLVEDGISPGATLAASAITLAASGLVFFVCARSASGLGLPLAHLKGDTLSSAAKGARPSSRLVIVQVAVACAALIGAGMLRDSLNHALQTGPGTTSDQVAVIHTIAPTRYEDPVRGRRFQDQALERVSKIPGVLSADWTSGLPLVNAGRAGYSRDARGPFVPYDTVMVSSGYFATMQHPVLEGREFKPQNDAGRADAAVINLPLAQALFPEGALRRHLYTDRGKQLEIVGVASDARYRQMAEPVRPTVFVPMSTMYLSGLHLVARTHGHAYGMIHSITEVLLSIDSVTIDRETTLDLHLQTAVRRDRVASVFVTACALMILVFAISGPYLLTRHFVTSRHQELAVRLAIGARGRHIAWLVLFQAAKATAAGVLIGGAGALVLAASLGSLTGETAASTTPLALGVAALLAMSCATSAALPAIRIFRLRPAAALR
jgi:predicted permease